MKNNKTLKWLYERGKCILFPLSFFVGCNALLSLVSVWFALVSKNVIDTATGQAEGSLKVSLIVLICFLVFQLLLQIVLNLLDVSISGKLEIKIKDRLFGNLLKKDYLTVEQYHTGELMNRLNSDVRVIVSGIITIIPAFIGMLVKICSSFAVLYLLAPVLAVCILSIGPFVFIAGRFYSKRIKQMHKDCQQSDGITRSYMQEILQNILAIKTFGTEDASVGQALKYQMNNYRLKKKRAYFSLLANVCLFLIFTAGYYVTLGWGAYQLSKGILTYGTLTAMLQLVGQLQAPFRSLSSLLSSYFATVASAERIMELEELEEEIILPCQISPSRFEGIFIDHLSFSYPGVSVFENATLSLKKGEFLAIFGQSGIGKSTLLKLMLAILKPKGGAIYLLSETDKTQISKNTRSFFSYVPQRNLILSGSIRDNIRFYRNHISDEQINQCAEIAQMTPYLSTLPDGMDTVLKEGGEGLSEGQIQRIAIARALLSDAPVLLLDEATSALDEETEINVLKNIRALTDKTCIIVSHKKAALEICDKVISVQNETLTIEEVKK